MRDQVKWKGGLRKVRQAPGSLTTRDPKSGASGGLREFRLRYNQLGVNFATSLVSALRYDEYLRVLDLRHNKFTSAIFKDVKLDFLGQLKSNDSLTNIDFRENDGFSN